MYIFTHNADGWDNAMELTQAFTGQFADEEDDDDVPLHVNEQKRYYQFYQAYMLDMIREQAQYISRAPTRAHFLECFHKAKESISDITSYLVTRNPNQARKVARFRSRGERKKKGKGRRHRVTVQKTNCLDQEDKISVLFCEG